MTRAASPTLEMLWESDEPRDALRDRFGFDDAEQVAGWVSGVLGDVWDVRVVSCERLVMSDANALAWVVTSSGPMIAKWSVAPERFARLAALARLTAWLAEEGLPVSAPVPTSAGDLQVELNGASLGLQRQVPGVLLDVAHDGQVRAAGATLARLHAALARYPGADRVPVPVASADPLATRVAAWLALAPEHVPAVARAALGRLLADAPREELPAHLVHGDFRSANVLCAGDEVAGVLDLEEARVDYPVVELARSAVLLGTRFHDWGPVASEVRSRLLEGYVAVRPLTPQEAAWWPVLVLWDSVRMVPPGADPTGWGAAALAYVDELGLNPSSARRPSRR
jgi:homoserine kinase type II